MQENTVNGDSRCENGATEYYSDLINVGRQCIVWRKARYAAKNEARIYTFDVHEGKNYEA